uniref:GRAM domain-containing protein n=1 Tax=Xiphophorus maculatus TaxID=8083 RepID=A0A3B5PVY2_XIPMA
MLRCFDKIQFWFQRRDNFLDSPSTSDTESSDDVVTKTRFLPREEEKPKSDLNEVKGLLESLYRKKKPNESFVNWLHNRFGVYMEYFCFQPEETIVEREDPLRPRKLTDNIRRLEQDFRPVAYFMSNLSALSNWYSVYTTAIVFIVYMYAAWHGWTIPIFLLLLILRLSLKYLISRGWRIQWSIVPDVCEPLEHPKDNLNVFQMVHLALIAAQKAQKLFGNMANILEKIKNLCMWVRPELTLKIYVGLWLAFIFSCMFPYQLLGFIIGVFVGIKLFIIDLIFKRCPKLRQRFDAPYTAWTNLPTDLQLKEHGNTALSRWIATARRGAFHEAFNLPESERPLDRKTPKKYISPRVLYVTENYLCIESYRNKRNIAIKLNDITEVKKHKAFSVLPGSGMGISVAMPTTKKPMLFTAMTHRDEAFDAIFSHSGGGGGH